MCDLYLVWGSIWLYGVFSGVRAACVLVCAVCAVVSSSVICSIGVPCVGSLARRYAA